MPKVPVDELSLYYDDLLEDQYDCLDRIVLNAYFPVGQSGGGFRSWWRKLFGDDSNLTNNNIRKMAGDFGRRIRAYAEGNKIPVIDCESGERKHEYAEAMLPEDPDFKGLFLVLTGIAPAPVWRVHRSDEDVIVDIERGGRKNRRKNDPTKKKWPMVKHYYFHIIDPEWGHIIIRMCGYPPFGAQVILNGHEWVERKARERGVQFRKEGNCFVEGSDGEQLTDIALVLTKEGSARHLEKVANRWIYGCCVCFGLSREEQKRSDFRYRYSVYQLEYSRNLIFERGWQLDEIYQGLLDRTRKPLGLQQVKTIFGRRHRPRIKVKPGGRRCAEVSKSVKSPEYDLTVFKVKWGKLTLKIYDKARQVLRVEVVVHNCGELKSGKLLDKWAIISGRMQELLVRFLATVQAADRCFIGEEAFENWTEPSELNKRRMAGIDLNKVRMRSAVETVGELSTKVGGFQLEEMAERMRERLKCSESAYHRRHAFYDLSKLRSKGLVEKIEGTHCYEVEPNGLREVQAYVTIREKVIKPILAGVVKKVRCGRPRKMHEMDQRYEAARKATLAVMEGLGMAV